MSACREGRERADRALSSSCRGCLHTFSRAQEVVAAAAGGLRRRGSTPDAKNALVRPHNGCTRARAYHRSRPSSVMDEMWARAVVPDCLRSFVGSRSMCRRGAALPDRLVVLQACTQRAWKSRFELHACQQKVVAPDTR